MKLIEDAELFYPISNQHSLESYCPHLDAILVTCRCCNSSKQKTHTRLFSSNVGMNSENLKYYIWHLENPDVKVIQSVLGRYQPVKE